MLSSMYPFFRGGHYYYFDFVGTFVSTDLTTSHTEKTIAFILSNASILIPFVVTLSLWVAVMWKLKMYKKSGIEAITPRSVSFKTSIPLKKAFTRMINSKIFRSSTNRSLCIEEKNSIMIKQVNGLQHLDETPTEQRMDISMEVLKQLDADDDNLSSSRKSLKSNGAANLHVFKENGFSEPKAKKSFSEPICQSGSGSSSYIIAFIISLYIVCLLPGIILNIYEMLNYMNTLPGSALIKNFSVKMIATYLYLSLVCSTLLFTLNSTFNPFIYHFRCHSILPKIISRIIHNLKIKMLA